MITFEREDSLNTFIEKAIPINGVITQELLTTIFTPGTACHDGAIIIRKNRIMCAGAYFPSTDKYDIPKSFWNPHRAAIGISEKYDALTIVLFLKKQGMYQSPFPSYQFRIEKRKGCEKYLISIWQFKCDRF